MATDVANLQITVDSGAARKADDDLQDLAVSAQNADNKVDNLGNAFTGAGKKAAVMGKQTKAATGNMGGFSRSAGQAGIQIQQLVGQIQGGQNAMQALSAQSADLGIVLGAPLVGVVVSLGAVLVGTLMSAFSGSAEEADELSERIIELAGDMEALTKAQRDYANLQISLEMQKQREKIKELNTELSEAEGLYKKLSEGLELAVMRGSERGIEKTTDQMIQQKNVILGLRAAIDTENQALQNQIDLQDKIRAAYDESGNAKKGFYSDDEIAQQIFENNMRRAREEQEEIAKNEQKKLDIYTQYSNARVEAQKITDQQSLDQQQYYVDLYSSNYLAMLAYQNEQAKKSAQDRIDSEILLEKRKMQISTALNDTFNAMMQSSNRELFEAGKYLAAGKATMDAYASINATLAQGGALAWPVAIATGAAALANVTSILSTKFGQTSAGGVSQAPTTTSTTNNNQVTNYSTSNTYNVSGSNAQSLAAQIQELQENGEIQGLQEVQSAY